MSREPLLFDDLLAAVEHEMARAEAAQELKERAVDGNEASQEGTWTLEVMMEDFLDRKLLKDVMQAARAIDLGTAAIGPAACVAPR